MNFYSMSFNTTEYPITWFNDRYREGTLTIKPPFQRKPVWAAKQKCYLIESILMNLPVPEIYIQSITSAEGTTTYAIVDGQQRIRSILQFIGSETDPDEQEYNKFVLDKIDDQSPWKDVSFDVLSPDQKMRFFRYKFAVRNLETDSDSDVRDMFQRLNKFLTPATPQELRNATYTGPFVTLVLKLADNEYWAENRIVTPAAIRRMGDVQFISELLIGVLHGPQGGSPTIIDEYYKQYEDFDDDFPGQREAQRRFDKTLNTIKEVLPDIKETRWQNKNDFYTLFVALATLLATSDIAKTKITEMRKSLGSFADEVGLRLRAEDGQVSANAIGYVRAVEKGANDKKRRADRQEILIKIISPFFKPKPSITFKPKPSMTIKRTLGTHR
jgi:hypothetical protein